MDIEVGYLRKWTKKNIWLDTPLNHGPNDTQDDVIVTHMGWLKQRQGRVSL